MSTGRTTNGRSSDHEWDRLTLQEDGKYHLVQDVPTKAKSEKAGYWTFTGGDPAEVMLDHAGYPSVPKGGEVRLLIDHDVGIWYSEAKWSEASLPVWMCDQRTGQNSFVRSWQGGKEATRHEAEFTLQD